MYLTCLYALELVVDSDKRATDPLDHLSHWILVSSLSFLLTLTIFPEPCICPQTFFCRALLPVMNTLPRVSFSIRKTLAVPSKFNQFFRRGLARMLSDPENKGSQQRHVNFDTLGTWYVISHFSLFSCNGQSCTIKNVLSNEYPVKGLQQLTTVYFIGWYHFFSGTIELTSVYYYSKVSNTASQYQKLILTMLAMPVFLVGERTMRISTGTSSQYCLIRPNWRDTISEQLNFSQIPPLLR